MISAPVTMSPVANEPASPMAPIKVGMAPPPIKNPNGTENATARLRACAGVIAAIAAKAAGKNHTASNGWNSTATLNQLSGKYPKIAVTTPVNPKLITIVCLAPSLSEAHPPSKPRNGPCTREKATIVLAQLGARPRSTTR